MNFWDFNAWGTIILMAVLLISLLVANALKKNVTFIRKSLVPTPVIGGLILLVISTVYELFAGVPFFNTGIFDGDGLAVLEIVTYHCLALGFIAQTLKRSDKKMTGKRAGEVFDTGVTTVSTYLLQGVLGMGITLVVAATVMPELFPAAGVLLPFGYGQGSGQALNYGNLYETDYAFVGGRNFGLTIAALGFLSASIGGVIHLNILKKRGIIAVDDAESIPEPTEVIEGKNEIPMNGTIDKLTVQIAFIAGVYALTYLAMFGLGLLLPGMKATIYGFNFLIGVLMAMLCRVVMNKLRSRGLVKKRYTNNFLLTHISNLFFDIMIVAGIAAIRLEALARYWWLILVLGVVGMVSTYLYNRYIAYKFFPEYRDVQFLAMYGMLTGTASTGVMLLRELDPEYKTPAADNLVYQNLPAIAFGFPMMLLAALAPKEPILTFIILVAFFVVMNVILFRRQIFSRFIKKGGGESDTAGKDV